MPSSLQEHSSGGDKSQGSGTGEFETSHQKTMQDSVATSTIRAKGKGEEDGICAYRNDGAKKVIAAVRACVYFSLSPFLHPQNIRSWFAYSRCHRQSGTAWLCELHTPLLWNAPCLISAPSSPNFNISRVHFQGGVRWHFPLKISRLDQPSCYHIFSLISSPNSVCVPMNHPSVNLQKMPTWLSAFSGSSREWKDAHSAWGLSPGCSPIHCF